MFTAHSTSNINKEPAIHLSKAICKEKLMLYFKTMRNVNYKNDKFLKTKSQDCYCNPRGHAESGVFITLYMFGAPMAIWEALILAPQHSYLA